MAKKSFSDAIDNTVSDNSSDPMANLLGATSTYMANDEVITPRPIVPTTVLDHQGFGDGEEMPISAEQILRREKELAAGDKGFKGTGEILNAPSPTLPTNTGGSMVAPPDQEFSEEEVPEERKQRRRAVIAKFSAKFINNIVAGASVAAHSYFVAPDESVMERHTALMSRVASLSPTEGEELQRLDRIIKRYGEMDANFAEQAKLDEEDTLELQECIHDITSTEDVNLHPGWLILIIVGIQLITNAITIFTNRVSVRK